ncbi:hypothetical protein BGZ65_002960 [Modicella reniformis]|uniref:Uncharacterized protein n=1 Tax=Modicella reniformis TaxID=1440133 RepID=A0A9P6STP0_9FUNG|nr:hypothetical protein BGZ65_002960 [Modicella reniformis]
MDKTRPKSPTRQVASSSEGPKRQPNRPEKPSKNAKSLGKQPKRPKNERRGLDMSVKLDFISAVQAAVDKSSGSLNLEAERLDTGGREGHATYGC